MIKATITTVDGDQYPMMFTSWAALGAWMENKRGTYTGIKAKEVQQGRREHDNDGSDPRITRLV